jgi:hypothetical protein
MFANPMMLPFMLYRRWLERLVLPRIAKTILDPEVDNLKPTRGAVGQTTIKQNAEAPNRSGRRPPYTSARKQKARKHAQIAKHAKRR